MCYHHCEVKNKYTCVTIQLGITHSFLYDGYAYFLLSYRIRRVESIESCAIIKSECLVDKGR